MRASLLAGALVVLAGCIGVPPSDDGDAAAAEATIWRGWSERALVSGHEHGSADAHRGLTTPNFATVGYEPLVSASMGTTVPGSLCGDVGGEDGRQLAVVQGRSDVVFSLADVSQPEDPVWLGEFVMRHDYVYDVAMAADGRHVALVTIDPQLALPEQDALAEVARGALAHRDHGAPRDAPPEAPGNAGLWWRPACDAAGPWRQVHGAAEVPGQEAAPHPYQLVLVNIEDPAQPFIADTRPLAGFGHGVSSGRVDGRVLLVASALSGPVVPVATPSAYLQTFHFYEVLPSATGGTLAPLSVFTLPLPIPPSSEALRLTSGHNDAWMAEHPVLGIPLAYLAAGDAGVAFVDLSDPRQPRLLSTWTDFDPLLADDTGNLHSVFPLASLTDGGRHYTVVGPEFVERPALHPSGVVRVLDTTDPAQPFEVAAWTLPHDVIWEEPFHFSTHYFSVVGKTLFVSMYHAGVWAVDLRPVLDAHDGEGNLRWVNLPSVGAYLPVQESPHPPSRPIRWAPTVEEAIGLPDGSLVTFDSNSGLYVFRYDEARPMEAPSPWPLAPSPVAG